VAAVRSRSISTPLPLLAFAGFATFAAGCPGTRTADLGAVPLAPPEFPEVAAPAPDAGPLSAEPKPPEPAAPPAALEIALAEEQQLTLVEVLALGEKRGTGLVFLEGVVRVTLTNRWERPVRLVQMDPVNLVFTREDTGELFSLLHPCDPGLLLGPIADTSPTDEERIRERSLLDLAPGQTVTLRMGGDWGCGGGPWKPVPEPGHYLVEYRIHPWDRAARPVPTDPPQSIRERLEAAHRALSSPAFWEGAYRSNALEIEFARPRPVRRR